jgi:hypothetical protein
VRLMGGRTWKALPLPRRDSKSGKWGEWRVETRGIAQRGAWKDRWRKILDDHPMSAHKSALNPKQARLAWWLLTTARASRRRSQQSGCK